MTYKYGSQRQKITIYKHKTEGENQSLAKRSSGGLIYLRTLKTPHPKM